MSESLSGEQRLPAQGPQDAHLEAMRQREMSTAEIHEAVQTAFEGMPLPGGQELQVGTRRDSDSFSADSGDRATDQPPMLRTPAINPEANPRPLYREQKESGKPVRDVVHRTVGVTLTLVRHAAREELGGTKAPQSPAYRSRRDGSIEGVVAAAIDTSLGEGSFTLDPHEPVQLALAQEVARFIHGDNDTPNPPVSEGRVGDTIPHVEAVVNRTADLIRDSLATEDSE